MMARLAVIPARGGSKRIPNKNILEFAGKPMIAYTIESALRSELFSRVVVSTDSPAIASVARDFGADVPFLREAHLADDVTPTSEVTIDALTRLDPEGELFDAVAQLMPNCPLRREEDIQDSHSQFEAGTADSQISVSRFGWLNPWWAMKRDPQLRLEPLFKEETKKRSQDLQSVFCPTGAVWWGSPDALIKAGTFFLPGHTGWEIAWHRAVDIDTKEDWELAELLMQARKKGDQA